ncbi:hypothetical protein HDU98_001595 [Podochytrium sp. JEL0797]|nr:hypothetical protein HDU98_001595 [Podochytrium sp. JEL0797]
MILSISFVLAGHRVGWGVYDLFNSSGVWDPTQGTCNWMSGIVSAYGCYAGDIAINLFSTVVTIWVARGYLGTDLRKFVLTLVAENVIRSVIGVTVGATAISITQDYLSAMYLFGIQTYLYTQLLNSEFLWFRLRTQFVMQANAAWVAQDKTRSAREVVHADVISGSSKDENSLNVNTCEVERRETGVSQATTATPSTFFIVRVY